jgi:predicted unusual protein kinase regulating ubiquinone biosynthesis (AarF/ABC1/UbiB family)
MIPGYAIQFDQFTGIGFAHGDLHAHNIMKSDTFRLTGYAKSAILSHFFPG